MARSREFYERYYYRNIRDTRQKLKESVSDDNLIIQCICSIDDIDRASNLLVKRLREWYGLESPEFSRDVTDNEKFAELIAAGKDKKVKGSMGADLTKKDNNAINELASGIHSLYSLRSMQEKYLQEMMKKTCPNLEAVAGTMVGARLLAHAGSLKRLSMLTAPTIQLLGAEKALFRHMRTGSKAPKHGIILLHPILQSAPAKSRGKAARALSDKISIAAKVDYFKGKFIGDKLKKELDKRLKKSSS